MIVSCLGRLRDLLMKALSILKDEVIPNLLIKVVSFFSGCSVSFLHPRHKAKRSVGLDFQVCIFRVYRLLYNAKILIF